MARKSIDSRLDRIMDTLLPPGSMEHREYYLPDHLKGALQTHQTETAAIIDRAEKTEPGGAFTALLAGTLVLPTMPRALREALGLVDPPIITEEHAAVDAAQAWADYAFGEDR